MLVDERADPYQQFDAVAQKLRSNDFDFFGDDMLGSRQQVGRSDVLLDAVTRAVQFALVHPGEVENRLTQRLRRNGAGVDAHSPEHVALLDHRYPFTQLGRRDGSLLPTRAGADHNQVVFHRISHRLQIPSAYDRQMPSMSILGEQSARRNDTTAVHEPCCN